MSKTTKSIMGKLQRRLDRYANMEGGTCGFDERVEEALRYRKEKIERFIADELERLVEKAGEL